MRKRLLLSIAALGTLGLGLFVFLPAGASPATTTSANTATAGSSQLALGKSLFDQTCSTCHGVDAKGGHLAPNLTGLGAATVDLWVSSGWMPLAVPTAQPVRKPALFNRQQTLAIANYVASLTPGKGIPIPSPNLKNADVAQGFSLFSLNCAPCHTITGAGDALSDGFYAPPLHGLTATQIQEAIETGPSVMPRFIPGVLTPAEVTDVVAFVNEHIQHAAHPGGLALGGVGPVAEGFIGLFVGVGVCLLIAMWIGERTSEDEQEEQEHGSVGHPEPAHG